MLEPVYRAVSNTAVREDMWVRIPPAAPPPLLVEFACVADPPDLALCADRTGIGDFYVYLLGIYLGDGMLSYASKRTWKLRVFQDKRYPLIVGRIQRAMTAVNGNVSGLVHKTGCWEIVNYWKHWPCVFPQHGPGPKHRRSIVLEAWQLELIRSYPHEFLRGLVHSDGCRSMNWVNRPTKAGVKRYGYVRYFFTNASAEIRQLFVVACGLLDVDARRMTERVVSVAKRDSVACLDAFIGPKY